MKTGKKGEKGIKAEIRRDEGEKERKTDRKKERNNTQGGKTKKERNSP